MKRTLFLIALSLTLVVTACPEAATRARTIFVGETAPEWGFRRYGGMFL